LEVYLKLRKVGKNVLLAICDAEILGRTLRKGKVVFEIKKDFYGNIRTSVEEAVIMIENSTIINMIGENIVKKAIEKGYVHPEAVLDIEGIPHAQIIKI
jgi:hypothetical protein